MVDMKDIIDNGKELGGGKDREVYLFKDRVYKIAKLNREYTNAAEYRRHLVSKHLEITVYNPVIDISMDCKVLEVERCLPFKQFIKDIVGKKIETEEFVFADYDMYELIQKFKLEKYLPISVGELDEFLFANNRDNLNFEEVQYYNNWGYNINRKQLVLLDYAD